MALLVHGMQENSHRNGHIFPPLGGLPRQAPGLSAGGFQVNPSIPCPVYRFQHVSVARYSQMTVFTVTASAQSIEYR